MAYCTCGNHVICWSIVKGGKVIKAKDKPFSFCGTTKKQKNV